MKNLLLPIGSIVTTGKDNKMIMIAGYGMFNKDDGKFYDYFGVTYPLGFDSQDVKLFNKESVRDIIFVGYQSKSFMSYKEAIDEYIGNIRSGKTMEEAVSLLQGKFNGGR